MKYEQQRTTTFQSSNTTEEVDPLHPYNLYDDVHVDPFPFPFRGAHNNTYNLGWENQEVHSYDATKSYPDSYYGTDSNLSLPGYGYQNPNVATPESALVDAYYSRPDVFGHQEPSNHSHEPTPRPSRSTPSSYHRSHYKGRKAQTAAKRESINPWDVEYQPNPVVFAHSFLEGDWHPRLEAADLSTTHPWNIEPQGTQGSFNNIERTTYTPARGFIGAQNEDDGFTITTLEGPGDEVGQGKLDSSSRELSRAWESEQSEKDLVGIGAQWSDANITLETHPEITTRFSTFIPTLSTASTHDDETHTIDDNVSSEECHICHTTFQRRSDLRRHMKRHDTPTYWCEIPGCSKEFYRMDKLRDHVRRAHKGDVSTDDAGLLKYEDYEDVRSVGQSSSHHCTEPGCNREFRRRADLLRHQRTHLTSFERPFRCDKCHQSFLYPKDLRRHEKTHEDDNKTMWYCEVSSCPWGPNGHGFPRRDNLLRHIRRMHSKDA